MTIYDKLIAAKDYSKTIKYLVIVAAAQFEKCKVISRNGLKYHVRRLNQHKMFSLSQSAVSVFRNMV